MSDERTVERAPDQTGKWLYRVGGISALVLGLAYIVTIPIYVAAGIPPSGGEAWLEYGADKTTVWWVILALSVLPDILFIPVGLALYLALKSVNRDAMLVAIAFVLLFVALDLAVTWPNYAALITVAEDYAAATTEAQRAAAVAAATYASAVLGSTLAAVYSIVTLSVGILMIGVVMLRGVFSRLTAYLGIASGVLSIASVVGSLFVSSLGTIIIFASLVTTIWVFLVGYRLYRLGQ